jgi:hypothetical protein
MTSRRPASHHTQIGASPGRARDRRGADLAARPSDRAIGQLLQLQRRQPPEAASLSTRRGKLSGRRRAVHPPVMSHAPGRGAPVTAVVRAAIHQLQDATVIQRNSATQHPPALPG